MLIAPPIGGGALQITHLLPTGSPVKTGDVVFEFDPSEQQYKLEQNRSDLLQAEQEIAKADADAAVQTSPGQIRFAESEIRRAQRRVGRE